MSQLFHLTKGTWTSMSQVRIEHIRQGFSEWSQGKMQQDWLSKMRSEYKPLPHQTFSGGLSSLQPSRCPVLCSSPVPGKWNKMIQDVTRVGRERAQLTAAILVSCKGRFYPPQLHKISHRRQLLLLCLSSIQIHTQKPCPAAGSHLLGTLIVLPPKEVVHPTYQCSLQVLLGGLSFLSGAEPGDSARLLFFLRAPPLWSAVSLRPLLRGSCHTCTAQHLHMKTNAQIRTHLRADCHRSDIADF